MRQVPKPSFPTRAARKKAAPRLSRREHISLDHAYLVVDGIWSLEKAKKREQNNNGKRRSTPKLIEDNPELIIETDGLSEPNPGHTAIGVHISGPSGNTIKQIAQYLGKGTNNTAEYRAVIRGLEVARELGKRHVLIRTDSQLVAFQLKGLWEIRHPELEELNYKAKTLLQGLQATIEWIPREENGKADSLSRKAIEGRKSDLNKRLHERAARLKVTRTGPDAFRVDSESTPGVKYEVSLGPPYCPCPYFENYKHCKHLIAAQSYKNA